MSDSQQLTLAANGIGGATQSFYRLFGDINGDEVVNAADNLKFKQALTTYNPAFDFNDDGIVNAADNLKFKNDLTVNCGGFIADHLKVFDSRDAWVVAGFLRGRSLIAEPLSGFEQAIAKADCGRSSKSRS